MQGLNPLRINGASSLRELRSVAASCSDDAFVGANIYTLRLITKFRLLKYGKKLKKRLKKRPVPQALNGKPRLPPNFAEAGAGVCGTGFGSAVVFLHDGDQVEDLVGVADLVVVP